jgi:hypothetical protein
MGKFVSGETITGWGVVRSDPWHLAGVFASKDKAEAKAAELGSEYKVIWGDNRKGSDDFMWDATDPNNA